VKVLKPGRDQKGWSTEAKCTGHGNDRGGCGAELLVEETDLFQTSRHPYDGSHEYLVTFQCSECGVCTDLPEGLYPHGAMVLPSGNARAARVRRPAPEGG